MVGTTTRIRPRLWRHRATRRTSRGTRRGRRSISSRFLSIISSHTPSTIMGRSCPWVRDRSRSPGSAIGLPRPLHLPHSRIKASPVRSWSSRAISSSPAIRTMTASRRTSGRHRRRRPRRCPSSVIFRWEPGHSRVFQAPSRHALARRSRISRIRFCKIRRSRSTVRATSGTTSGAVLKPPDHPQYRSAFAWIRAARSGARITPPPTLQAMKAAAGPRCKYWRWATRTSTEAASSTRWNSDRYPGERTDS